MGRKRHLTDAQRQQYKQDYREMYYVPSQFAKRGHMPWSADEIDLILAREYDDHELSEMLERSVMAIQVKRYFLMREKRYAESVPRVCK